jgi:hypothetical protein
MEDIGEKVKMPRFWFFGKFVEQCNEKCCGKKMIHYDISVPQRCKLCGAERDKWLCMKSFCECCGNSHNSCRCYY